MDKKTSEEGLAEASAQQDPWSDSQGELPHIAAQSPLVPRHLGSGGRSLPFEVTQFVFSRTRDGC